MRRGWMYLSSTRHFEGKRQESNYLIKYEEDIIEVKGSSPSPWIYIKSSSYYRQLLADIKMYNYKIKASFVSPAFVFIFTENRI